MPSTGTGPRRQAHCPCHMLHTPTTLLPFLCFNSICTVSILIYSIHRLGGVLDSLLPSIKVEFLTSWNSSLGSYSKANSSWDSELKECEQMHLLHLGCYCILWQTGPQTLRTGFYAMVNTLIYFIHTYKVLYKYTLFRSRFLNRSHKDVGPIHGLINF